MDRFARQVRDLDAELGPLPLPPGPVSNGEFVPGERSSNDADIEAMVRRAVDESARRVGMDRRRFLQTASAVAASLAIFEVAGSAARASSHVAGLTAHRGGTFAVPEPVDMAACEHTLSGREFIFDVHTHHVVPAGPWVHNAPETVGLVLGMLPAGCTDVPPLDCVDRTNYLHDIFLASDTTVAMLSDVPNSGPSNAPVPFSQALDTQALAAELAHGGASRLLVQNIIAPNVGPLTRTLDEMSSAARSGRLAAFKVYTAWSPRAQGYSLENPRIGLPTVQHAHDLGVKVFVAHKGLPLVNFDPAFNHPDDMVALSRQFPDMDFVIYHAAWDPSHVEGPYNKNATVGIDSLLTALDRHRVSPNDNVWVDLGTTWRSLLLKPDQAAHALGKLLSRVGAKRVMWGTDAIWYGSPQPQIMAMRAFQITDHYQELYGYPALTPEVKAGIFGLNAASLFGLDPASVRCALATDPLSANRAEAKTMRNEGALASAWEPNGPTTRREILRWLASPVTRWRPT